MASKDFHAPLYKREFTLVDVNGVPYDGSNPLPVSGGGGGGGGAVTLAAASVSAGAYVLGSLVDGAIVTLGALGDAAVGDASGSLNAHTRQIAKLLGAGISLGAGAAVIGAVTQSGGWTVTANAGSGTFAISAAALPLPAGAATEATLASVLTGTNKIPASPSTDRTTAAAPFAVRLSDGASFITNLPVQGAKTHNAAAPGATNIGALPAIATAAAPTLTEGNLVGLSSDLSGFLRGIIQGVVAAGASAVGINPVLGGMNGAGALVRNLTEANAVAATTGTGLLGVGPLVWDLAGGVNWQKLAGDASGRQIIVGAAATGAAVAGSPVLMGAGTTAAGGNAQSLMVESATNPSLRSSIWAAGSLSAVINPTDVASAGNFGLVVANYAMDFDGAAWNRHRNNLDVILLASASRTTTQNSANITAHNARAVYVCLDVTVPGTGSITLSINWICPASGKVINLLTGAAVTTTTTNVYKVGIGLTAAANAVDVDYLCRTLTINVTANNANAVTYSVGYCLIAA